MAETKGIFLKNFTKEDQGLMVGFGQGLQHDFLIVLGIMSVDSQ